VRLGHSEPSGWPPKGDHSPNLAHHGQQGNAWSASRLACACGYRVRCEVMRYGENLGELVFFDDKEASSTWGERVWHCPGCNDRLGLLGLLS